VALKVGLGKKLDGEEKRVSRGDEFISV
jgi:hypothetical protein